MGVDNVRAKILTNLGGQTVAGDKCYSKGLEMFEKLKSNLSDGAYRSQFAMALKNLKIKIGYDKKVYFTTNQSKYQSLTDYIVYPQLSSNAYFEFDCLELKNKNATANKYGLQYYVNDNIASISSGFNNITTTTYDFTAGTTGTQSLLPGVYKIEVAGGGGGGGGFGKRCEQDHKSSESGGAGGKTSDIIFILEDSYDYTYTVGKGGSGGEGRGDGTCTNDYGFGGTQGGDSNFGGGSGATAIDITGYGGKGGRGMRCANTTDWCQYRDGTGVNGTNTESANNAGSGRSSNGWGSSGGNGWVKIWKF